MGGISVVSIFANRSISANASIVTTATPIYLGKGGPDQSFWVDLRASGRGYLGISYQIADNPDDTFYTPVGATVHNRWKNGLGNAASRDRVTLSMVGTKWAKFKAADLSASPVTKFYMDLIIAQKQNK